MFSSAIDDYQPAELNFELTRKYVKVLQKYQFLTMYLQNQH